MEKSRRRKEGARPVMSGRFVRGHPGGFLEGGAIPEAAAPEERRKQKSPGPQRVAARGKTPAGKDHGRQDCFSVGRPASIQPFKPPSSTCTPTKP